MFNFESLLNLLNIISIIGFLVTGIIGIVDISKNFNLSHLLISINSIILFNILIYLEFLNYKKNIEKLILIKGGILIFYGILLLGINTIGCAFGTLSIIVGIINNIYYYYFFKTKKFSNLNMNASINQNYNMIQENFINNTEYCE